MPSSSPQDCYNEIEGQFKILADGTWLHNGTPINRDRLVKLFSTVLRKEGDRHVLRTPVEVVDVEVEDAAYIGVDYKKQGTGKDAVYSFKTNIDQWVDLTKPDQLYMRDDKPYIALEHGLEARLNTAVYYKIADEISEHEGQKGIWSKGNFYALS